MQGVESDEIAVASSIRQSASSLIVYAFSTVLLPL